jgi:enoyl-[acyl-carrier protein] reductase I
MARLAAPLMEGRQGSIVCLTYLGSDRVVDGYNLMGVAKAALEANTRYLAADLGPQGVRVNAISAGPVKTVSAMGIGGFSNMLDHVELRSPLLNRTASIQCVSPHTEKIARSWSG